MNLKERERLRGAMAGDGWSGVGLVFKCAACIAVIGLLAAIGLGTRDGDATNVAQAISPVIAP